MFRYSSKASNSPTPDDSSRSRLPLPRNSSSSSSAATNAVSKTAVASISYKRALSPPLLDGLPSPAAAPPFSSDENGLNDWGNRSSLPATPSPSKQSKVDSAGRMSIAQIVKHRFSLAASPLKARSNTNGIFSNSSSAQSTRRLSLGAGAIGDSNKPKLNSYGIRSDLSGINSKTDSGPNGSRRLLSFASSTSERIKVCVRKRPLSDREVQANHPDILELESSVRKVAVLADRLKLDGFSRYTERHEFYFDRVFDVNCTNSEIYSSSVQDLVETVISGGRATCFAYGQTGSGKTHTMLNAADGLYHLAAHDIFRQTLQSLPGITIHVSFYEIYQNNLHDLLNQKRRVMACEGKDGQVHIMGLAEISVRSVEQLQGVMTEALNSRSTGTTSANSASSRSHAILQLTLKREANGPTYGKFSFIDLAGSERGSDRINVDKQAKLEGAEINKSLLALKECIRAIDQDSIHLPFRQSKLTLVLKDSFLGNAKTCMIATVSPTSLNCENTINTLRYADRVKELKGSSGLQSPTVFSPKDRPLPTSNARNAVTTAAQSPLKSKCTTSDLLFDHFDDFDVENINEINLTDDEEIAKISDLDLFCSNDHTFTDKTQNSNLSSKPMAQVREALHHSIAVLYDRVSSCKDVDLLELLQDELDGIMSAFSK